MEFNVSSAELLKALMDVSRAIPAKSALPILENFLFSVEGDVLTVTASDQEITLRTTVQLDSVNGEGSIAVPAHQFTDLIKALPDQPISIRTTSDSSFECVWSSGNSSLPYFPSEDYPAIGSTGEDSQSVTLPAQIFTDGISGTIYATADDEMRPTMNGIFFDIMDSSVTLVASDSHKLICYTQPDVNAGIQASFILHKKAAAILRGVVGGKDIEGVDVTFDNATVVFKFGKTMMVCRLIVGKYPRYRDVIPQNNSNILKIDRAQLVNTVKRVSVCANKASNHVKLELKNGQVEVTAQDLGFAIAAYEKVMCDYSGEDLSIGFKSAFLIEILSNMTCETVMIKFADSRRAALIVPSEEEAETDRICGILMPIMVS